MTLLLALLNASALCVADTDICAPPKSSIRQTDGVWTINAAAPMKALGVELDSGPVDVTVTRDVIAVRGRLLRETVISGASVAGTVQFAKAKGQPGGPQLVAANELKKGRLQVFDGGTVEITPGMRIQGAAEAIGGRLEITSGDPIRGFGLEFARGTLVITRTALGTAMTGMLARPQEVAGVLLTGAIDVVLGASRPQFRAATLGRVTPLESLGLLVGTAPAGTKVTRDANRGSTVSGPGPFTVCGLSYASDVSFAMTFSNHTQVRGTLAGDASEIQPGLRMTGTVATTYEARSCLVRGVDGMLAADTTQNGIRFAAKTAFTIGEIGKDRLLRGTVVAPTKIGELAVAGVASVQVVSPTELRVLEGTLSLPAKFEQWNVPAGTHVLRLNQDVWSFETPPKTPARANGAVRGERFDNVTKASSQADSLGVTVTRPHRPKGSSLSFAELTLHRASGCIEGTLLGAQRSGMFTIPAGGMATVCNGQLTNALGPRAPTLQIGNWFATDAIAAPAGSSAPTTNAPWPPNAAPGRIEGYWIQIASLCSPSGGTRPAEPPDHWIWVDRKGRALTEQDRATLARDAARPGKPCPPPDEGLRP